MRACGLCSSDVLGWYVARKAPLVLGHEPAGVVAAVGKAVRGFRPGDRVFVHHHAPCFRCRTCRRGAYVHCPAWRRSRLDPGGMAEYFRVPGHNLADTLLLPDGLSFADGALVEPVACCVKALRRARLRPGDTVLVVGLGFMGQVLARLARAFGAGRVVGAGPPA
ncbi:MAG: alcohol dehydrogenase catalytic domain-containing protein, partial [Clostridia bacterium]|nr:alcohol dehydrogenase catalytic domain-containing protein [Clostridia bacterium]